MRKAYHSPLQMYYA